MFAARGPFICQKRNRYVISMLQNASSSVILWGGTGQAKVIRPILEAAGHRVVMVFDNARIVPPFAEVPMGGDWNDFVQWRDKNVDEFSFVVCIGGTRGRDRVNILEGLMSYNLTPITVLHGTAWLADSSYIDQGCQILAMAAVCENARLGVACILILMQQSITIVGLGREFTSCRERQSLERW